jgi:pilus assembly protein CpaC
MRMTMQSPIRATAKGQSMKRRFLNTVLTAVCAAAPLVLATVETAQAQSVMRPGRDLVLSIGRGQLVNVGGSMTNVFVADDKIADVEVKSPSQLYVFGKGGGETTVYASNSAGDVIWSANVRVGNNIESLDQMLKLAMPDAKISVATMGANTFLLTGTVASPEDAAEAQRLVSAFVGGTSSPGKGGGAGSAPNVISRLKTATPLQINLLVRFAEVSRSLVREINTNIVTRDLTGGFTAGLSRGRTAGSISDLNVSNLPQLDASSVYGLPAGTLKLPFDPVTGRFVTGGTAYSFLSSPTGMTTLGLAAKMFGVDMLGALDLGEKTGLVTTLAQPNLTALSGETADFLAGGEYPIPVSQSLGTTTIEYKKYGVSLAYTPTVLANGRISIRVRPEVSELSTQGAVSLNGYQIPALTIRRAETTVELGSGQSFMIAGLLSNSSQNLIDKTPGAGDVPVLGALFRSTNFRKGETELVIVVTPYLVNPVDSKDIKLPTDGFKTPNILQSTFGHMESSGKSGESRPLPSQGQDKAPNPGVSMIAPSAPAKPEKPRKSGRSASADAPAPGFNLN